MRTGRLKEDYVAGTLMKAGLPVEIVCESDDFYHCVANVEWEFYAPKCIVKLDQPACDGPGWHDVPTCPGLWMERVGRSHFFSECVANGGFMSDRGPWYGPIPECPR